MKWKLYLLIFFISTSLYSKEWKNFKVFQKETHLKILSPADWLKSDRINCTIVWQQANKSNLENNRPKEYNNLAQRRDFYNWLYLEAIRQGHEVVWFKMVHYISKKLQVMETFPYTIFANKKLMEYAYRCSEIIFNNAFYEINHLFKLEQPLKENEALQWDKEILHKEQYIWADSIINTIDLKTEQKIERILQGKFLYSLLVPKEIRFTGNLSNKEDRYNYALNKLRSYCKTNYN